MVVTFFDYPDTNIKSVIDDYVFLDMVNLAMRMIEQPIFIKILNKEKKWTKKLVL